MTLIRGRREIAMDIRDYLQACMEMGASDLHFVAGEPPVLRKDGRLQRSPYMPLPDDELREMLLGLMNSEQRALFERDADVNFGISLPGFDRFRVNVHRQRGVIEAALRRSPLRVPSLRELGLPTAVADLTRKSHGLVLVTGPVGMGKTTTLTSMVELINAEQEKLIISIEDPIEHIFVNRRSIVKQREVTVDTPSFAMALRNALRQDPNVIVISEMRDLETTAIALTAAETGHLVLATLHCPDTAGAIQRIIDIFPAHQQTQVRLQLAANLQGVISQTLLPKVGDKGRTLATEILLATSAVRNVIREHKLEQITTLLETGVKDGMRTRDRSIIELAESGLITCATAEEHLLYPERFTCPTTARVAEWQTRQQVFA
jgi:twitching motility protein PilT